VLLKCSLIIAFCASCVIVQACRQQESKSPGLIFAHEISPQPPRVGKVTITLNIKDAADGAVAGARLNIEGSMSHAGMVPVFADATEIEPGRYRAVMELSMAGDWNVTVHLTLSDGRKLDHEFEIKGVER
jgi:YtkA-like protein